jgi:DUF971 family protein
MDFVVGGRRTFARGYTAGLEMGLMPQRAFNAMSNAAVPQPVAITVHQSSRVLEIAFDDGARFRLPFELLRVFSPSAEVQGHGPGQEVLQTGKRDVTITELEPVGHYAIQPRFSDGHETGIFTWGYLYQLGADQDQRWAAYEQRLKDAGLDRDAPMPVAQGAACGHH